MDHIVENLIGSLLDAQHDYAEESIDSLKNDGKEVYIYDLYGGENQPAGNS